MNLEFNCEVVAKAIQNTVFSDWKTPSKLVFFLLFSIFNTYFTTTYSQTESHIRKKFEIKDGIAPKSIVASGNGLFSAQNMMYRHTVTLYNAKGERIGKINDGVNLTDFGFDNYVDEKSLGAPVEGCFTKDGMHLWVSNYHMTGTSFSNPGCDDCIGTDFDHGFIYKINTTSQKIEKVIEVGSVPKFLAISETEKWLLVSNWVSSDISIIDLESETEVKRITVGPHPRGIAITKDEKFAYATVMGSTKIVEIDLSSYAIREIRQVGKSPRSILMADHDSTLYISLNTSHEILKYNRFTEERLYCKTPEGPRSMSLSPHEKSLYVVNYFNDSFTKINTDSMQIEAVIETSGKPIGICGNWENAEIWVACYSGKIEIFKDFKLDRELNPPSFWGFDYSFFQVNPEKSIVADEIEELEQLAEIEHTTNKPKTDRHKIANPKTLSTKQKPIKPLEKTKDCSYYLIVGAFSILENAEKKRQELSVRQIDAELVLGKNLTYTYVSVGCSETETEAETMKIDFIKKIPSEKSTWILKK